MTTIAFDGRILAADRASWRNNHFNNDVCKLFLVDLPGRGLLAASTPRTGLHWYAAAGDASRLPFVMQFLQGRVPRGDALREMDAEDKGCKGMLIGVEDAACYLLTSRLTLEGPMRRAAVADGGGFEIALGAMLAGADAKRAVQIVAERSGYSALGVDWVEVGPQSAQSRSVSSS